MTEHTSKIVSMIDGLAQAAEQVGDIKTAARLDIISQLVVTAEEKGSATVALLAADLRKYFPSLDAEQALIAAKKLHTEYGEEGEEKEGIFPTYTLPNKERRQGPRPEDVPIGTTEDRKSVV